MCPRVASINKCRAPRVNDDTLSARHCITECIYSICPGTKVWGSTAGHRSLQIREASCSKQAMQLSCCRRLLAAKVRWTVCLSLTRLALPALCLEKNKNSLWTDPEGVNVPRTGIEPVRPLLATGFSCYSCFYTSRLHPKC